MKKTLAALAVLGAFAGTSLAADVTLYGVIDTGFNWTNVKKADGTKTDTFQMASGQNSGPRFGLKGTETLGNGLVVGFNLENSFNSDDGTLAGGDRLFHRESLLFVQGAFGEVSFGRTGALDAGTGRYNLMGSGATSFGTGWDNIGKDNKIFLGMGDRMDNTVTYKSPSFAGVTVYAQASLKMSNIDKDTNTPPNYTANTDKEGSSDANRYYAVAATYKAGALNGGVVVSANDYKRGAVTADNDDNGMAYSAYVNYDFGMVKPMLAVQYYDQGLDGKKKGYGIVAGAVAPVLNGTFKVTAGWNDSEQIEGTTDYNDMMVGVGYEYPLSKRTKVYAGAGYMEQQTKAKGSATAKVKTTEVMAGLVHSF